MQEGPSDGHPDAWFTRDFAETGPGWVKRVSRYENQNEYEPLWYHDHTLGMTRLNVYAGLAGFYRLRDPEVESALGLPSGDFDRELLLQDRSFDEDGSLSYPDQGVTSAHPVWNPEFFGDVNLVNGVAWPFLEVEPRRYRFLLLNGANARFYELALSNGLGFTVIGTDGGLLGAPEPADAVLLGPGERVEIVVDFSALAAGTTLELVNDANAPFPGGDPVDEHTSKVMQFRVVAASGPDDSRVPPTLGTIPDLGTPAVTRSLTLVEVEDDATGNPLGVFLDGKRWGEPGDVSEIGRLGQTEIWELVNLTDDAHPIHLHLVDFQVIERQPFDADGYRTRFEDLNPTLPAQEIRGLDVTPFLQPDVTGPEPAERGWKDTVHAYPGQVTRLKVRWAPELGGSYPFDATAAPGYVWHCHILEHEDNEMMRRFELVR
jgi:FtsP/CotA-like multicopper oxidase with cupredoxin domain